MRANSGIHRVKVLVVMKSVLVRPPSEASQIAFGARLAPLGIELLDKIPITHDCRFVLIEHLKMGSDRLG
jgi:hypothetical protein